MLETGMYKQSLNSISFYISKIPNIEDEVNFLTQGLKHEDKASLVQKPVLKVGRDNQGAFLAEAVTRPCSLCLHTPHHQVEEFPCT